MSETRIFYGVPKGAPRIVQLSVSRMDLTPASEIDIPHYCLWDDGSEYEVHGLVDDVGAIDFWYRRYHGPMFGRAIGDWTTETAQ